MPKVFGIEEAKRAEEFASTKEQRDTVLAVSRMFNIPIVIKAQVKARVTKLKLTLKKKSEKVIKLSTKVNAIRLSQRLNEIEELSVERIAENWS